MEKTGTVVYEFADKKLQEKLCGKAPKIDFWFTDKEEPKVDVDAWWELYDSRKREDMVKYFIAETVESYLNGVQWDPQAYTALTLDEWIKYVWDSIEYKDGEMDMVDWSSKQIYFYGKDKVNKLIKTYVENYSDIVNNNLLK